MFDFLRKRKKKKKSDDDDNIILLIKTLVKNDIIVLGKIREITREAKFIDPKINSPYDIIAYANWNDMEKKEKEDMIKKMMGIDYCDSRLLTKIEDDN